MTYTKCFFLSLVTFVIALSLPHSAQAQLKRVNLEVLVISAGDVGTQMVKAGLDEGLVPYTEIDLTKSNRPVINDAYLADRPSLFVRRAKYQAVVMPSEAPAGLTTAERTALVAFEREFKIRQLDAYVYPTPTLNMNWPSYLGTLDGMTAQVSAAGKAGPFSYLAGPVPLEDLDPSVFETYGYLSIPMAADTVNKRSVTSLVDVALPEGSSAATLVGVLNDNGREEMFLTSSMNQYQLVQQVLFPGILNWLTYGVHLGTEKNFLAVHIDDVFLADARWAKDQNCTVGDDCPATVTLPDILMTTADVDYLLAWQQRQGVKLDMVYNGAGYDEAMAEVGSFPLGQKLIQSRSQLRWINHTYTHAYLGCIQDFSVSPWRCVTDARGQVQWTPYATVYGELNQNITFAQRLGLPFTRTELVTGEHSGLRRTPQEPSDNPNLISALNNLRFSYLGSDNSRESAQRKVGNTLTVPRYPMNIFYNTGTKAEAVDEYNWIYTSRGNGGSGLCENNATSTCIAPLDASTGFDAYIVPLEARLALLHMLSNSPRPHYAHQSNLAEERTLYPVLDRLLAQYRTIFATNTPVVNMTTTQAGNEFQTRSAWSTNRARVSAYVQGGSLVVDVPGLFSAADVPLTAPAASSGAPALTTYGGVRTGWQTVTGLFGSQVSLPSSVLYPR